MNGLDKAEYWFDSAEYDIEARYPLHKDRLLKSLTAERCEAMIQKTEALFLWIKKKC